jgi:hypothetical protein
VSVDRGRRLRILALCGAVAPIIYTVGALAAGAGYPGYSHMKQFVSELGATGAPMALVMNAARHIASPREAVTLDKANFGAPFRQACTPRGAPMEQRSGEIYLWAYAR